MKKRLPRSDRQLGMQRDIGRRDFIHGLGLASLGLGLAGAWPGAAVAAGDPAYPPVRNGMRGAHPGSFEVAHQLASAGRASGSAQWLDEDYDLAVVGGGISGLAAAWYYRRRFGPDARILVLDNHDDFGGHAKRNEFHQGGVMRLAWGGTMNLEFPSFSATVHALLAELGVDLERLQSRQDFHYGNDGARGGAVYFDAETFGRDVLIPGFALRHGNFDAILAQLDQAPLDPASIASLKRFYSLQTDVLAGRSEAERERYLRSVSYIDFLKQHGGLTDRAAALFVNSTHGYWGIGADSLSVAECEGAGLPMQHLLGGPRGQGGGNVGGRVAMFPDGNASIARLLVRSLVPAAAPGRDADDIVTAPFDYARLDEAGAAVRLRLESTVVEVARDPDAVRLSYVRGGQLQGVRARHCVLACYHTMIPHLCRQLPAAQQQALAYQVKRPLILTNVLLENSKAADRLGISGAHCPGRLHGACWLIKGIEAPGYRHGWQDDGPVVMQFWGSVAPPVAGLTAREQHQASRARLLAMSFDDFEREVRSVLDGMLGPAGFDVAREVLAITVNRWPHGYAYDYLDLWDPDWAPGQAPHEIARQAFGPIAIANSDAGADAYTHVAIDQAWRAVGELPA